MYANLIFFNKYLVSTVFLKGWKFKKKNKTKANFKEIAVLFLMLEVFGGISKLLQTIWQVNIVRVSTGHHRNHDLPETFKALNFKNIVPLKM